MDGTHGQAELQGEGEFVCDACYLWVSERSLYSSQPPAAQTCLALRVEVGRNRSPRWPHGWPDAQVVRGAMTVLNGLASCTSPSPRP